MRLLAIIFVLIASAPVQGLDSKGRAYVCWNDPHPNLKQFCWFLTKERR